ncbi:conserved hypothetical protein [Leishmania mexicana MHOM/GT/2001/U1103]|uniref:DNA topoisomerase (ATP-hydrolyzing) n=1 Tax=Leishmania mexicana (strain MHOM/GT/2001/U1103) TaxID=929439 RepID=E9AQM2_LEIMU|nr:conserved hypothetical protein [Leishmania mexicana MHOM/GT/2001/U1103]CBZ25241.1 conserved hypothetical protein [Leishmania mexicana MHOM/GT/2001/U1103]
MADSFTEVSPAVVAAHNVETMRDEVLRRMEVYVLELLHTLLSLPIRRVSPRGNTVAAFKEGTPGSLKRRGPYAMPYELQTSTRAARGAISPAPVSIPPEGRAHAKMSLPGYEGAATQSSDGRPVTSMRALQTVRHHLLVLTVLFRNVVRGDVATQRDVYYHLVRHIQTQEVVNRTVQQLSHVLRLPRQLMGVVAGGRGYIAGCLSYRGVGLQGSGTGIAAEEGMPLPLLSADLAVSVLGVAERAAVEGDDECGVSGLASSSSSTHSRSLQQSASSRLTITQYRDFTSRSANNPTAAGFQVPPNVCAILVVEKHAVFSQLLREGLLRLLPCVLLTAQGYPTHAARRLLANLHTALPRAAVVGLVDYNPHGLAILAAYRWAATSDAPPFGSASMESRYYAVPTLRWLGVRAAHVARVMERRDSGGARAEHPSTVQCPRLRHHTPPPLKASARPWEGTGKASGAHSNDSAAASALSCASSTPHTAGSAAIASPLTSIAPLQYFTHRDAVVMRHQIKRLGALLHPAASSPAAGEGCEREMDAADGRRRDLVESSYGERAECASVELSAAHQSHSRLSVADLECQADRASVAAWLSEAREMQRCNLKCEVEVLYTAPYAHQFLGTASVAHVRRRGARPPPSQFAEWVCQQVLRRQYI